MATAARGGSSASACRKRSTSPLARRAPAWSCVPRPRAECTTTAPAASARATVSSVLPASTTSTWAASARAAWTARPIRPLSFQVGMMTESVGERPFMRRTFAATHPPCQRAARGKPWSMLGIIGGTGLGEALFGDAGREQVVDTPFGAPSSPVRILRWKETDIAVLSRHGEGHLLSPGEVPYRANVFALKQLGVTRLLVSGAVGSLREQIRPRDLVVVDQLIDRTYRRTPTFFDRGLAVHVEMAQPYCPRLREAMRAACPEAHPEGTYVCIEGPSFSTVAEARAHRAWGADVVGMTAMPEARLAREAEMCCALLAFATDYDCWRPVEPGRDRHALLEEIIGNLRAATARALDVLRETVARLASETAGAEACACQSALALGIWSQRDRIRREDIERYGPLLSRHLS